MKNKNLFIVAALIGFIFAWSEFVVKPYNKSVAPKVSQQASSGASSQASSGVSAPASDSLAPTAMAVTTAPAQNTALAAPQSLYIDAAEKASKTEIELAPKRTLTVYASGSLGSAVLADYGVRNSKEKAPVVLMTEGLKWSSNNPAVSQCLSQLKRGENSLVFTAAVPSTGVQATCRLEYLPNSQKPGLISARLELKGFQGSKGVVELRGVDRLGNAAAQDQPHLIYLLNDSKNTVSGKSLFETHDLIQGKLSWAAWGDRYFATVLMPRGNYNPNLIHGAVDASAVYDSKLNPPMYFGFQYPLNNSDGNFIFELDALFSQRESNYFVSIQPDLEKAVELGYFATIARALIFALNLINKIVGNYGFSIIALTLIVRLLFWPLNKKVFESGRRMKELAPEMERIKAKYGDDKSKMNEMNLEIMGLYKKHGVNPMGSCLPMLLQLPIWFGLYQALNHSLALYQAPFALWIHDLSAPDPYFVFPVLWTISLMAYMYVNPQPTQPGQPDMRWMMYGMNVFIGYMSHAWPSGLTIYLFVSNLVGIAQQVLMLRAGKKLQPIQEGV